MHTTHTHHHHVTATTAYEDAPSIVTEIAWVTRATTDRFLGQKPDREFWLRKAAVLDRIAIEESALYAPEVAAAAVSTSVLAARRLVEADVTYSGLSLKGSELVTDDDHRDYVRRAYRQWLLALTDQH
ncbi:hypothetical protein [Streptomyces corynorhini]|uniref:Uncharacterized protein n=1 Tax=Streptomyces corynorhini TaxID=2282652 RepID=A0A370B3P6_9ACTN|nr:hypothetical protein [Streptomyces corynorhini]RDG36477.1 hypothetical protein DVH02_19685 [Streptomyces corynorhini]